MALPGTMTYEDVQDLQRELAAARQQLMCFEAALRQMDKNQEVLMKAVNALGVIIDTHAAVIMRLNRQVEELHQREAIPVSQYGTVN